MMQTAAPAATALTSQCFAQRDVPTSDNAPTLMTNIVSEETQRGGNYGLNEIAGY